MSRKKILFLSSWYPTPAQPTHGIFVQRHAEAVSILNDVLVLYVYGGEKLSVDFTISGQPFQEALLSYRKKDQHRALAFYKRRQLYQRAMERIISEWGVPDIIHLNVIYPTAIIAIPVIKKYKIPFVITEHWTGYLSEDGNYKGWLKKYITRKAIKLSRAVMPVTHHLATQMQAHGLFGNYLTVPNVVDTDFFLPSSSNQKEQIVFLHLSSLNERQKNPYSIIDAFYLLSQEVSHVRLIIAGDGNNITQIKAYAMAKGLDEKMEYHFLPEKHHLLSLLQRCDAMVLNSNFENLPVVLLEAMSCGKPVISSAVGGIAEFVNESNGILFSPPGVKSLTEAMKLFCRTKHQFSTEVIRMFAIHHFSRKVIAQQYDSIYSQVV